MTYSLCATAKIMTYLPYYYKNSKATNVCSGNTLPILYGLAINKVTNSIAYPPNHLGGLDSSSRISNDSDVASERFRGVLYPDLGKSSRKRSSFSRLFKGSHHFSKLSKALFTFEGKHFSKVRTTLIHTKTPFQSA